MYQVLVVGLSVLFVFMGGYFIRTADGQGIVMSAFEQQRSDTMIPGATSSSGGTTGKYICDEHQGCPDVAALYLGKDKSAHLVTTFTEGGETLDEHGLWRKAKGVVIIDFSGNTEGEYDHPTTRRFKITASTTLREVQATSSNEYEALVFEKESDEESVLQGDAF